MASKISAGEAYVSVTVDNADLEAGLAASKKSVIDFGRVVKSTKDDLKVELRAQGHGHVVDALDRVGNKAVETGGKFQSALLSIAASTVIFRNVGTAVSSLITKFGGLADSYDRIAKRTGIAASTWSEYAHAAQITGTSIESMEQALKGAQKLALDAATGTSEATNKLRLVGLQADDLAGLSTEEMFEKLALAVARIEDPTKRAAVAMKLFEDSGTQILPLLDQGEQGILALKQEAHELGVVVSDEAVASGAEFVDSLGRVKAASAGVSNIVVGSVTPALTSLFNRISQLLSRFQMWSRGNGELIRTIAGVSARVLALGSSVGALALGAVGVSKLTTALKALNAVVVANPWSAALVAIGAVIAALGVYRQTVLSLRDRHIWTDDARQKLDGLVSRQAEGQRKFDELKALQELSEKQELNNAQRAQAVKLVEELKSAYGDVGVSVDKVTGAIRIAANAQQELNRRMLETRRNALEAALEEARNNNTRQVAEEKIASETDVSTLEYVWGRKNEAGYRGKGAADFGWGGVFGMTKDEIKAEVLRGDAAFESRVNALLAESEANAASLEAQLDAVNKALEAVPTDSLEDLEDISKQLAENEERRQKALADTAAFEKEIAASKKNAIETELDAIDERTSAYKKELEVLKELARVERAAAERRGDQARVKEIDVELADLNAREEAADSYAQEQRQAVIRRAEDHARPKVGNYGDDKTELDAKYDAIDRETTALKESIQTLIDAERAKDDADRGKLMELVDALNTADEAAQERKDAATQEVLSRSADKFATPAERFQRAALELQEAIIAAQEAQESGNYGAVASALDRLAEAGARYDTLEEAVKSMGENVGETVGGTFSLWQAASTQTNNLDKQIYNETRTQTGYLRTIAQRVGRSVAAFS